MYRLAHLSDIHLGPLPSLSLRELASKRVTGYVNWHRNRRRSMFGDTLTDLVLDLKYHQPDHIAVTGDLVNLATKTETKAARIWLQSLGLPHDVSLVPGNHDAYVPGALKRSHKEWHEYLIGDNPLAAIGNSFPYMRVRGNVAIFGVSTAEATAPFFATGSFRRGQALALAKLLENSRKAGHFRVVLIHHPPISGAAAWHKRLIGKQFFSKVMKDAGAELVLHGHTHLDTLYWLEGPEHRKIPVVGVPSASQSPGTDKPAARYNLFEIDGGPGRWELVQRERGLHETLDGIGWVRERHLLSDGRAVDAEPREDAKPATTPVLPTPATQDETV
ncbi:metallophosphoesterase [Fulvimarina sp. 2208YS6-2-32]|uniref:Metallophosphoesterase n=1 Tax=Fulvimarina uroteuthidis TaxID=3098149 RepID=A0ABU5I2I6_9HYPH|nr:metallophosphoesterase [Fulvimarina sp. 2208YS6-2-32]MDY8109188.1 metallophosphoesterase [Fulvimarina sp. 2208YS6-2-32]